MCQPQIQKAVTETMTMTKCQTQLAGHKQMLSQVPTQTQAHPSGSHSFRSLLQGKPQWETTKPNRKEWH